MALAGKVVLAVRIDDRDGRRQVLALMVVDDDDIRAQRACAAERLVLVVPQSTVTISFAPSSTSSRWRSALGP